MSDSEGTLVQRRSRRATAGNRMEAALAELAVEEVKDTEDDNDFIVEKDEEDIFESDFASTDEEESQDEDAGENTIIEDNKRAQRAARARVEKATAIAHARQQVTFDPHVQMSSESYAPRNSAKPKRRVSLGVAINVETGEIIEGTKRQSQRRHTIMNTSATVNRMRDAEERKASIPKKVRLKTRALTQDELISRALDTEEGNIIEHQTYLQTEEEKRRRARVVRPCIEGPSLKWISRREEVQIVVEPAAFISIPSTLCHNIISSSKEDPALSSDFLGVPHGFSVDFQSSTTDTKERSEETLIPCATSSTICAFERSSGPHSVPMTRTECIGKSYLIHCAVQSGPASKPTWVETMTAMFGNHVQWEELRVLTGKQRPLGRPQQMCQLTGHSAIYLDPRTNVPYANVRAYHTLTKILSQGCTWSEHLGCYTSFNSNGDSQPPAKRRKTR